MKITVFGANGPTGRILVAQALREGHEVVAFTRHPESFPLRHDALRVDAGDIADIDAVAKAVTGQDVVLSSLGGTFGRKPVTVYSQGARTILTAMTDAGVDRFVGVTSSVMEENPEPVGGVFFRRVLQPFVVNVMGRTVYDDMRRMEAIVSASAVTWTIVRPSGLYTAAGVSRYQVTPRHGNGRFTSRQDLADCLLREAGPGGHPRQAIAVLTTENTPTMRSIIWNEGIRRKR